MKRFFISLKMVFLGTIRNRTATFFNLIFPMVLFLFFGYIFKGGTNVTGTAQTGGINTALWLLPGIITISIATNGIFNSMPMVMLRENGVFRRIQATPMPVSQYLLARIVIQLVVVAMQVVLALIIAAIAFQAYPESSGWYLDVAFILIGAVVFITIGQFIAAVSPRFETANIISQIINLPLVFLSNIYIPFSIMPDAVQKVGRALPGFLMVDVLRPAMIVGNVSQAGTTLNNPLVDLAGLGIYFIVALVISARFFRWS
ncbi:MAG TPA: ABC transporter permease [Ktedonobacterales bacterium]